MTAGRLRLMALGLAAALVAACGPRTGSGQAPLAAPGSTSGLQPATGPGGNAVEFGGSSAELPRPEPAAVPDGAAGSAAGPAVAGATTRSPASPDKGPTGAPASSERERQVVAEPGGAPVEASPAAPARGGSGPAGNGGATDVGVTSDTILLGGIGALSGAVGQSLGPFRVGYDAWVNYFNARGGVHGRKLKMSWMDTAGDSARYASAERELVEGKKVFALTSADIATGSGADYLAARDVPVVGGDSGHVKWYTLPNMYPVGNQYYGTRAMAAWAVEQQRGTKFAVMWLNLAVSIEGCQTTVDELERRGFTPVYTANVPVGTPDLSNYVTQARNRGADAILQCFGIAEGVALMRALQRQDWHPYVGAVSGSAAADLLKAASPEVVEGMEINFPVASWTDQIPNIDLYHRAMAAFAGRDYSHTVFATRGFASAMLLTTALEGIGPTVTRQRLREWLDQQQTITLGGLLPPDTSFTRDERGGHPESRCSQEWRVEKGRFVRAGREAWFCL